MSESVPATQRQGLDGDDGSPRGAGLDATWRDVLLGLSLCGTLTVILMLGLAVLGEAGIPPDAVVLLLG